MTNGENRFALTRYLAASFSPFRFPLLSFTDFAWKRNKLCKLALHFTDNTAAANCALRGFVVGHKVSNARRNATARLREIISVPE